VTVQNNDWPRRAKGSGSLMARHKSSCVFSFSVHLASSGKFTKCRVNAQTVQVDFHFSDYPGGLNGSTQHFLEVYSQESENLKFVVGVDFFPFHFATPFSQSVHHKTVSLQGFTPRGQNVGMRVEIKLLSTLQSEKVGGRDRVRTCDPLLAKNQSPL
jgi:hypothetical protein